MKRRRLLRALLILAIAPIAVEAVYIPSANYYLRGGGRLLERINQRPDKFAIQWESAWTLWPGRVHLKNVTMRGRNKRLDWYAHLDTVAASTRLLPLFDWQVSLRSVSAAGLDYRHRRKTASGEEEEGSLPSLPAVGAFPELASRPRPDETPKESSAAPVESGLKAVTPDDERDGKEHWRIAADDIEVAIDQLWFGRYRMTGPMSLDTSMDLILKETIEFPRIHFTMNRGDVAADEHAMFGQLSLDFQTSLLPFGRRGQKLRDAVSHLTGRFDLLADSASLFFLEIYLKKAPWLHFNSNAPLKAGILLEDGRLMPGSSLESASDAVSVDFLSQTLTGEGRIAMKVEETPEGPRSRLEATLDEFELTVPEKNEPYAKGHGFKVKASSAALSFDDMFSALEIEADLEEAVIADLSHYNRYMPPNNDIAIRQGTGRISYHVEADQDEKSAHGWTDFTATDGILQFEDYRIRGDVTIHTPINGIDLEKSWFDISNTTIALRSRNFNWTGDIALPRARVLYSEPMQLDADVKFRMTDTKPLVAMFDAMNDISAFVENLMTVENIRGKTTLKLNDRGTKLAGLEVTGEDLLVLADFSLNEGRKNGILYIKFHTFSFGVAYDRGKKDLDLIRARKWFDEQRARRGGGRAGAASPNR